MVDIVSEKKRSWMMAGIKGKNTKPEILIRKKLHQRGFRYTLHNKNLPGNPDIVLKKYKTVVFVNGCFWHKHDCHLFKWPSTREKFWKDKINSNFERDQNNIDHLKKDGWRICVVWECCLKGKTRIPLNSIANQLDHLIRGTATYIEIQGLKS